MRSIKEHYPRRKSHWTDLAEKQYVVGIARIRQSNESGSPRERERANKRFNPALGLCLP